MPLGRFELSTSSMKDKNSHESMDLAESVYDVPDNKYVSFIYFKLTLNSLLYCATW